MLETFVINSNFVLLFALTFLYWLYSAGFLSTIDLPMYATKISCLLQAFFLLQRWVVASHFPLSNLYESLLFLSWGLTTVLILQINVPSLTTGFIGSIMAPVILLINTFAVFYLPPSLKIATSLVPALQSNWLIMHVTVMILSYAALLTGCLFAIAYLMLGFLYIAQPTEAQAQGIQTDQQKTINLFMATFDNLSYRTIGLGFPLLTVGLLSGAVWANQTWGSYWSWDPKETWALITWFIFAIYLHTRFSKGWTGQPSAMVAVFGFFIIWICYLGVNLMGKGLHSYGFFQN